MSAHWEKLQTIAQAEVESTLAALPAPLRQRAAPLPVSYEAHPPPEILEEGSRSKHPPLIPPATSRKPKTS